MINLGLTDVRGEAAVEVGYDIEARDTTGQASIDQDERLIQEEFSLGGSGWVYHPALLDINADFGVLFSQDFTGDKRGQSTETKLNQFDYDLRLGILPYKPYPISLFTSQLRTQINSPFSPRRDVDTLRYGAGLSLQRLALADLEFPTRMLYRHQETKTSSFAGDRDNRRDRDEAEFVMDNKTDRTRNRIRYNWKSLSSESRGAETASSRHDVRLSQETNFERGSLSSQFFVVKNIGSFNTLSLSLSENLNLQHGHSLRSSYGYALNYQETKGLSQIVQSGNANLSHQLYESLASSASLNAAYADSDVGTTFTGGGGGQLRYKKKIPGGSFGLRFAPNYLYTDDDVEPGVSSAVAELHDVQVTTNSVLDRPLVLASTVEVRDSDLLVVYTQGADCLALGTDYTLVSLGIQTAIQVCPGSALEIDVPIMAVNYDYRLEPALRFSTLTLVSGFSLELWDHFSGDLSYATTDQTLLAGNGEQTRLDDSKRLVGRVQANFDHSRTRFEYERLRSSINPRERYSVMQGFSFRPGWRTALGVGAGYDHDRVLDPNRLTRAISVSANITTVLPFEILARLNLLFRWIDQAEQRSTAAGPTLALSYRYGRLRFQLTDRLSWRRTRAKTGTGRSTRELLNTVFFRVERPF